uniref:uncharacterized protein LOC122598953 n=1 Tax=Erigeron canadensis TaxID=72917 RepID=UPI001CB9C3FF|nr:uncharacterized protein LOC122598953 [Erigeron canadensis]
MEKKPIEKENPEFVFSCFGRERVGMDLRCVHESESLHNYLLHIEYIRITKDCPRIDWDDRDIGRAQVIESPKFIITMVNDFCVGRYKLMKTHEKDRNLNLFSEKLREFDSGFVREKPLSILLLLLNAAIQLKIKSLLNLVRNAIADMHAGEFAVKISHYIKNSEVLCYIKEPWTMDGIPFESSEE